MGVTGWLMDEDDALKDKLSGFTVTNPADGRQIPIQTFFRLPDTEQVQRKFPHISIDLVEIAAAPERAHRALEFILPYDLETATPLSGFSLVGDDYPLPWDLIYQITARSRNPRHDRQLKRLLFMLFPNQYGSLNMANYDGTIRRADLISSFSRDIVDVDDKRTYQQIVTISVSSEFFLNQVIAVQQATSVAISYESFVNQPV